MIRIANKNYQFIGFRSIQPIPSTSELINLNTVNWIDNFCAYRKLSNDCTSLNWRIQCNLCVLTAKNTFLSFPAKYLRSHLMLSSIHKLHFIAKRLTVIPLNSSSRFVPLYQLFCPFFTLSHSLFQIWNILIKPRRSLVSHLTYSSISLYNINFNIHSPSVSSFIYVIVSSSDECYCCCWWTSK